MIITNKLETLEYTLKHRGCGVSLKMPQGSTLYFGVLLTVGNGNNVYEVTGPQAKGLHVSKPYDPVIFPKSCQ